MHVFSCGSPYGLHPCEALAKSVRGQFHQEINPQRQRGPIAVWGQIRGARELLEGHNDFYRLDHAYIGRNKYWRLTKGDFQPSKVLDRPADRWERIRKYYDIQIEDWQKGSQVVVALSMPATYSFFNVPEWGKKLEARLKELTDRPLVIRQRKETRPLKQDLKGAHALVTFASNSVVEALISGVPVFVAGPSIAREVSGKWLDIENPVYTDRERFFRHMAYCQFKIDEFQSGFALKTAQENAVGLG